MDGNFDINDIEVDDDLLGSDNNMVEDENSPDTDGFILFDHGFSKEDYDIVFKQKHPTNLQWKDVEGPKGSNVSATIDGAHQSIWSQAKEEIMLVRKKVTTALGNKPPSINNLVDLVFGPRSNLGRLLRKS
jgi:hypothetical protein